MAVTPRSCLVCEGILQHTYQASLTLVRQPQRRWPAGFLLFRRFASNETHEEHVSVPCASSGRITVSLYNIHRYPPTTPLLLYLPPLSQQQREAEEGEAAREPGSVDSRNGPSSPPPPPLFLLRQPYPVVSIHYRWSAADDDGYRDRDRDRDRDRTPPHCLWPTPLHDVLFGYDWVKAHLAPPLAPLTPPLEPPGPDGHRHGHRHHPRRDLYVYGAHLGGGLAAALALTETHPTQRVAIRGVAAYNGIYNWTAFVGGAGTTATSTSTSSSSDGATTAVVDDARAVQQQRTPGVPALPTLFAAPADLFDAFASPSLFFRTAGHVAVPGAFDGHVGAGSEAGAGAGAGAGDGDGDQDKSGGAQSTDDDGEASHEGKTTTVETLGTANKAYLWFPPLRSTLAIPSALLLHAPPPESAAAGMAKAQKLGRSNRQTTRPRLPAVTHQNNTFATQAAELAGLMRRSIDKVEIKRQQARRVLHPDETQQHHHRGRDDEHEDVLGRSAAADQRVRTAAVGGSGRAGGYDGHNGHNGHDGYGKLELGPDGQALLLAWLDEQMAAGT
ncbi:hypothetical protein SPI_02006 [Niveomyces insectorum RCEF 264]|uniref:Uncharacterized protein n=1 Tax=Niveomyces insectorum RCEF 264 TaxID=1081102 RepID=A0A167XPC7_9HYPO|nr:hypothetical protein SPI_02006 [Niveomyces insectorum RCEF 264]